MENSDLAPASWVQEGLNKGAMVLALVSVLRESYPDFSTSIPSQKLVNLVSGEKHHMVLVLFKLLPLQT